MKTKSLKVRVHCRYAAFRRSWCSHLAYIIAAFAALSGQVSTVQAAEFLTSDNAAISGDVIKFTDNTITIRLDVGSVIIVPRREINLIRYPMSDGSTIEGQLSGWDDGRYVVDVGGELLSVNEGVVVPEPAASPASVAAPARSDDENEAEAGSIEPDESPALAVATKTDLIEISAKANATFESASNLYFDISLSKPADHEIVLLYSTVDGTAKSGTDYQTQNGVLVLPAGTTSAQLATPLIDDDIAEEEEFLTLFVSVAPTAATVTDRQIFGMINDDD